MKRGFTLIELLISIVLMTILLSAVTLIFLRTTETVSTAEARQQVYTNARYSYDILKNDLVGTLPFSSGQNRFCMENGRVMGPPAATPSYNIAGFHVSQAADRLIFRTTTTVGDTLQTCEVTYEIIPGGQAIGAGGATVAGNPAQGTTARTNRPLYTLIRRVRVPTPGTMNATLPWTQMPVDANNQVINDMELCHFVISWNLEYFSSTQMATHAKNLTFSQLEPSYFTQTGAYDPLGNGLGINDMVGTIPDPNGGPPVPTPLRVPAIRVTMILVDDVGERQERIFDKVMWIPMG